MTPIRKYQWHAAIEAVLDSLQRDDAVNMRHVNEQLHLLYNFYSKGGSPAVHADETLDLWKKFLVIEAKLEHLEVRSFAFERLKNHLFPTV